MFLIKQQNKDIIANQIIKNNSGIALIITVIILTNLLMITLIITDVVLRIGKSSQQISEAEIAYLAAESAIEEAIYEIEENKDARYLGVENEISSGNLIEVDASWERYIKPVYTTPVTCIDAEQKFSYYNNVSSIDDLAILLDSVGKVGESSCIFAESFSSSQITHDNNLVVLLAPGKSFELDLNIMVAGVNFYPDHITIDWSIPDISSFQGSSPHVVGKIIMLSAIDQVEFPTSNSGLISIPEEPDRLATNPDYRIRIVNNETDDYALYLIDPVPTVGGGPNDKLPIGIKINSDGFYSETKKKERTIEYEKKFWQIY